LKAYVRFGLENPHHYRATFMMPIPEGLDKEECAKPDSPGLQTFDFLRRCVYDCIATGKFRSQDAEVISQTLWCGIHGVTSLLITYPQFPWVGQSQVIDSVVDTLIGGVAAQTAEGR
jgi:hypothetical protein